ncbi:hypothetical protein FACS1894162_0980 [Bacteroidia bacterium]|nr:hypothetical protein FACS1894162_0980 [Bacteroidia bacterium]
MLPGPDYIYRCPNCGNLLKRGSLLSGNTFGAILYSDGKRIAPMLPDFPKLTKCKKCDSIFWLNNLQEIGEYRRQMKDEDINLEWKNADKVEFLGIKDLFAALKIAENKDEEKTIRIWIWWAFNDRARNKNQEIFMEETDKDLWKENCEILLNLLNSDNLNEKIQRAELFRHLGKFENCIEELNRIEEKDMNWIIDPMKFFAKNQMSLVFPFQNGNIPNPNSQLPFFQERGELREKHGYYLNALEDYDKALLLDDKNPFFYVLKASVYEKLGKLDLMFENYDKALSIKENCVDAYINRALFYRRSKQLKVAQKDYKKAVSLEPRSLNITGFNEEDIFKYGKFEGIVDSKIVAVNPYLKKGSLFVEVNLSPHKKPKADTNLFLDAQKLPYFIFRKKSQRAILNKNVVRFEFFIAKCIFYVNAYILKKNIKFIDSAILN